MLPHSFLFTPSVHAFACVQAIPPKDGVGSAERYWTEEVLNRYPDTDGGELGPLQGKIVGALFFVWFVVFVSLVFGKQVLAKV